MFVSRLLRCSFLFTLMIGRFTTNISTQLLYQWDMKVTRHQIKYPKNTAGPHMSGVEYPEGSPVLQLLRLNAMVRKDTCQQTLLSAKHLEVHLSNKPS